MLKALKKLFYKFFDYDIVGEYYDLVADGRYQKKYLKKYHLRGTRGGSHK